MILLDKINLA